MVTNAKDNVSGIECALEELRELARKHDFGDAEVRAIFNLGLLVRGTILSGARIVETLRAIEDIRVKRAIG